MDATCSVDGCARRKYRTGICHTHYKVELARRLPRKCSVDGCDGRASARTWCTIHYRRWRRNGVPGLRVKQTEKECAVEVCTALAFCRGWCKTHYHRWNRNGTVELLRPSPPPAKPSCASLPTAEKPAMGARGVGRTTKLNLTEAQPQASDYSPRRPVLDEAQRAERDKARRAAYRARPENRQKAAEVSAAWREANPDRVVALNRAYTQNNPDKIREIKRRYRDANRDRIRNSNNRRKAMHRNAPVNDLTAEQWTEIKAAYRQRCAYCGKKPKKLTMDHVQPLARGGSHTVSNIVPACGPCNSSKNAGPAPDYQPLLM